MAVGAGVQAEVGRRPRSPRSDAMLPRDADASHRPPAQPSGARAPRVDVARTAGHPTSAPKIIHRGQPHAGVLQARFAGGVLIAIAGYGAIAISSPDGAIAGAVAAPLVDGLGWLALPWCVASVAGGAAMAAGPIAWRRPVVTRLIGVVLLLAGLAVATAPREPVVASDRFFDAEIGRAHV